MTCGCGAELKAGRVDRWVRRRSKNSTDDSRGVVQKVAQLFRRCGSGDELPVDIGIRAELASLRLATDRQTSTGRLAKSATPTLVRHSPTMPLIPPLTPIAAGKRLMPYAAGLQPIAAALTLTPAASSAIGPAGGRWTTDGRRDRRQLPDLRQGLGRRLAIEIQNADRFAARRSAADRHLGDVHVVPAEDRAHAADDARHVVMAEHQQPAVQIRFQPEVVERHQPRHVLAEDRARGPVLGRDRS